MTAPIRAHIRERLKSMRNPMVDLLLIRIRFSIRLADTFGHDLWIALLMASILAIFTLHASGILEKISAQSTTHDVVELLYDEFVAI